MQMYIKKMSGWSDSAEFSSAESGSGDIEGAMLGMCGKEGKSSSKALLGTINLSGESESVKVDLGRPSSLSCSLT